MFSLAPSVFADCPTSTWLSLDGVLFSLLAHLPTHIHMGHVHVTFNMKLMFVMPTPFVSLALHNALLIRSIAAPCSHSAHTRVHTHSLTHTHIHVHTHTHKSQEPFDAVNKQQQGQQSPAREHKQLESSPERLRFVLLIYFIIPLYMHDSSRLSLIWMVRGFNTFT